MIKPARIFPTVLAALIFWTAAHGVAAAQETPPVIDEPVPSCGAVLVAQFDWPAAEFTSTLVARLLEDGYGCDAELAPASPQRAKDRMIAFAEEAEDIERMITESGPQTPRPPAPPLIIAPGLAISADAPHTAILHGRALYSGGEERGFAVPEWFAATRPQLQTLEDAAAQPELFALAGERPVVHLCPVSWPCYAEGFATARAHGFDERFELRAAASGEELAAILAREHGARRPWIGYFWAPSAIAAEHPLRFLPQSTDASPARTISILFDARLAKRAPAAAETLARIALPRAALDEALRWREESGASAERAVDRFLEAAPEIWTDWLNGPAAERVATALASRTDRSRQTTE